MKLYDAFSQRGYHTTLATTFAIDFQAFEMIALARLREAGCMNIIVVADGNMLTWSLEDGQRPPAQAGRQYSLVAAGTKNLFHPKLSLQIGEDRARLIVASANLTASGLGGNLEVAGDLRMEPGDGSLAPLMRLAFEFLVRQIPESEQAAHKQLEWARSRASWLNATGVGASAPANIQLFATDPGASIGQRFVEAVGSAAVTRMIAVSPYWDANLGAIRWLQKALKPRKTALLIQQERGLFPGRNGVNAQLFPLGVHGGKRERFAHAKILIAQTKAADHVLFGSTNCTMAALGVGDDFNVEASLYFRMPVGEALETLELDDILMGPTLDDSEVAPYAPGEDIPLKEMGQRRPGRFHLRKTTLTWTPSAAFGNGEALEMLDGRQQVIERVTASSENAELPRVLNITSAPLFARVRLGTQLSAIAVIQREEDLLNNLRVVPNANIKKGMDKLRGGDFAGTFLCEALELFDAEELRFAADARKAGSRRRRGGEQAAPPQKLTYAQFMQARSHGPAPDHVSGNTLASSYVNEVRSLLNTVLDANDQAAPAVDESVVVQPDIPLGLGDETADGEAALEGGGYDEQETTSSAAAPPPPEPPPRPAPDNERTICDAVDRFVKRLEDDAISRELTTRDLFRVRLLLTVILAAGSNQAVRLAPAPGTPAAVLVARGEQGWPRLAGQVLFGLFGTESPAIHRIRLEADATQQVPVDILECIATCMWTVAALAIARDDRGKLSEVQPYAMKRAAEVHGMTILETDVMSGPVVLRLMRVLSERCAARLGVDAEELAKFHQEMVVQAQTYREIWLVAAAADADSEIVEEETDW
jgi:hypothetical protein